MLDFNASYITFSPLIKKQMSPFLDVSMSKNIRGNTGTKTILGWGLKRSGIAALKYSQSIGVNSYLLEDGFIRSIGLGKEGAPSHSYSLDTKQPHYNGKEAGDLISYLNSEVVITDLEQLRAVNGIKAICKNRISKYNQSPFLNDVNLKNNSHNNVLVVSQVKGDLSLQHGCSEEDLKTSIVESAINENPGANIYVKMHPDVISGKAKADISINELPEKVHIISDDYNSIDLLKHFNKVYVRSSLMGFEALMLGKEVHCFGAPFYAGWGLTYDHSNLVTKRQSKRTIAEVFHAAYINYSFYVNPVTGKKSSLEKTISSLTEQRNSLNLPKVERLKYKTHKPTIYLLGFSKWKQPFVTSYFPDNNVCFIDSLLYRLTRNDISLRLKTFFIRQKKPINIAVWGKQFAWLETLSADKKINLTRVEDGFIRSLGLGLFKTKPLSLIKDNSGIYFDPNKPSDLEVFLNNYDFNLDTALIQRAKTIRQFIVDKKLSKYNSDSEVSLFCPKAKKIIFVPGQVSDDASMLYGAPEMDNLKLLKRVREENPNAYIIFKPHPDVTSGKRSGNITKIEMETYSNKVVHNISISSILSATDEVHVSTSLVGFEALLRNIDVVCYGRPFYSGWGLTKDRVGSINRYKKLTLDQLVAAALIKYPTYQNPLNDELCEVEEALECLAKSIEINIKNTTPELVAV